MGSGTWSSSTYTAASTARLATNTPSFAYSAATMDASITPVEKRKAHNTLDPKGVLLRESRDTTDHPTSLAITVLFDVTGSMHHVPVKLQEKLPALLELLLRKGYVEHPQIQFGAIGDAISDQVPFQISQWESDNRMDEHLRNLVLEAGGGGTMEESYELALYFMARHTAMDCWEKRSAKGYLFIIGDEAPYGLITPKAVESVFGEVIQDAIPVQDALAEVEERFNVYLLRPAGSSYRPGEPSGDRIIEVWRKLLGQRVIDIPDTDTIAETIALTIGTSEGTVDLSAGLEHLREFDNNDEDINLVGAAVASAVGVASAPDSSPGTTRL